MSLDQTAAPDERTPLAGQVERVIFHNDDNGFCVLRVKARGYRDLVTVLGAAPSITSGEYIQASGAWENHREHGLQFHARLLRVTPPTSLAGIERYLGSGLIKGVGPVFAKRLVEAFGDSELLLPVSPRVNASTLKHASLTATLLSFMLPPGIAAVSG